MHPFQFIIMAYSIRSLGLDTVSSNSLNGAEKARRTILEEAYVLLALATAKSTWIVNFSEESFRDPFQANQWEWDEDPTFIGD